MFYDVGSSMCQLTKAVSDGSVAAEDEEASQREASKQPIHNRNVNLSLHLMPCNHMTLGHCTKEIAVIRFYEFPCTVMRSGHFTTEIAVIRVYKFPCAHMRLGRFTTEIAIVIEFYVFSEFFVA